jgi:hypothetical protein
MTKHAKALDHVALLLDQDGWIAGTSGTVVEEMDDAAFVELVGPDGRTLAMLTVPYEHLRVLRPGDHQVAV